MYVIDFEYANKMLSDFGCMVCHINTNVDVKEVNIGCDITFKTVKNNHSSIHSLTSSSYEDVYTTTFEIMKNVCNKNSDDKYMTPQEARNIVKWLNRREYHKFKLFNPYYDIFDICYYGSFNVKQIMLNEKILGLSLTFTSSAPYGFGDTIEFSILTSKPNEKFSIFGDSDEIGIIYPNIKIICLQDGKLEIANKTTGTYIYIDDCSSGEIICMDGEHKIIISDKRDANILSNNFNYEFLDIEVNESDSLENIYETSMPCEIFVSYSPIRKVGAM